MAKFKEKTGVLDSIIWDGTNTDEVIKFGEGSITHEKSIHGEQFVILIGGGGKSTFNAPGTYVLKSESGVCKAIGADRLKFYYDPVEE